MDKYMKVSEVAKMLGVSPETVRTYGKDGLLEPDKITEAGHRLYLRDKVENLAEAQHKGDYISIGEAMRLTGYSNGKITRLVRDGVLSDIPRGMNGRRQFSAGEIYDLLQDEVISAREAMQMLGIDIDGLNKFCEDGVLVPCATDARDRRLFKKADVEALLGRTE